MNDNNYSIYQDASSGIEPPELYRENPELLNSVIQKDYDLDFDFKESSNPIFGITNPFESDGYLFSKISYTPEQKKVVQKQITFGKGKKEYINFIRPYLYEALENNGIDADKWVNTLVAQTAFESGWGNDFSRRNNNFAGIKGKGSGDVETKEWDSKRGYYTIKDSFKRFNSVEEFADEYVKKLKNRFKAFEGSPSDFAANIRKRGYFTAPLSTYQNSVNRIKKEVESYGI